MDMNPVDSAGEMFPLRARHDSAQAKDQALRHACQQFEGLLVGIMLKEALRPEPTEEDGEGAASFEPFREFCVEQVASSLSESAALGIGDQLYEQMRPQEISP